MNVKPITPEQLKVDQVAIPDFVIKYLNELISEAFEGDSAVLLQQDIREGLSNFSDAPFNPKWMNFEPEYREAGWSVALHKPSPEESYPAYYVFSRGHGESQLRRLMGFLKAVGLHADVHPANTLDYTVTDRMSQGAYLQSHVWVDVEGMPSTYFIFDNSENLLGVYDSGDQSFTETE